MRAKGFQVFVRARNAKGGREAAEEIWTESLAVDVSKPESVEAAATEMGRRIDQLEVFVNNAGIVVDGDENVLENTLGPLRVTARSCHCCASALRHA
jgi:NAD(P)-dependent dehydrogenase (short-subunit alcohol dehydrogenase family)